MAARKSKKETTEIKEVKEAAEVKETKQKKKLKVAAYSGSRNLYGDMETAAKSLLSNSDVDKIYFLIEDKEFPFYIPKDIIETIDVSGQDFFKPGGPNMKTEYTYMALMRATYPKLFPDLDRILSMDVDTIVDNDISELWDLPIDDYYFAASMEPSRTKEEGYFYTNIGVALFNLEKLRDGMVDDVIENLNTTYMRYVDQDCLNLLCKGKIFEMPSDYNVNSFTKETKNPKIIHFAGVKEWNWVPLVKKYSLLSWNEVLNYRKRTYKK